MKRAAHRKVALAIEQVLQEETNDPALVMLAAEMAFEGGARFEKSARESAERACQVAMNNWLLEAAVRYGERAMALGGGKMTPAARNALVKAYLTRNPYSDFRLALNLLQPHVSASSAVDTIDTIVKVYMALIYG